MKLKFSKDINIFLSSDFHYGHTNIIFGSSDWDEHGLIYETRDFKDVEEMNSVLVDNINSVVKSNDILIYLGDWSFDGIDNIKKFRSQLICQNIIICLGNHDHHIDNYRDMFSSDFLYIDNYFELQYGSNDHHKYFVLSHYPFEQWNKMNQGAIMLHGHIHKFKRNKNTKPEWLNPFYKDERKMNVCIDYSLDFKPYNLNYIIEKLHGVRNIKQH